MYVHRVEAGEHFAKPFGTNSNHKGKSDSRVIRVASSNPVPELEHVGRVDPKLLHLLGVCRDGNEMFGHRLLAPQGLDAPLAGRASIRQSLQCRESLGGDDEERLRRVQISGSFHKLVAIDVGNEAHGQTTITEVPQCIVSHGWTQVGAANTDVNDIAHALAGIPSPGAAPHAVREVCHLIQHCVYLGYHVLAIDEDRFLLWAAQSLMVDRAILSNVHIISQESTHDILSQSAS